MQYVDAIGVADTRPGEPWWVQPPVHRTLHEDGWVDDQGVLCPLGVETTTGREVYYL
jgi:hypothetical protein